MYLELIVSFLSLAVAIYAILIARTANKRSQAAIDHSLPAVSYGRGHFDGNIVHYFSVKGGMMDGWHIQKIDLSKGRSDVRVRVFDRNSATNEFGELLYSFERRNWPICESDALILENMSGDLELKVFLTRGQETEGPSPFKIKPIFD